MNHFYTLLNRFFLSAWLIYPFLSLAQPVIKNTSGKALTFKEMQLQFGAYKKANDLSTKKYWKTFKRFEAEMQLHTNGRGEPDGFETYISEAVKVAEEKSYAAKAAAAPWSPVGPNALPNNLTGYMENGIGRVNCVAFDPVNTSVFYVGVAQGGIWKTTNGGTSYTPLTDNLPITRISDICIDPNAPSTIYASICDFEYIGVGLHLNGRKRHTHYGLGVYKSTDGGLTWNPTGLSFQMTNGDASLIRKVVVNSANSSQLLACGVSGMYRSNDAGVNWTKKLDSLFWDMEQDPVNPSIIYAATGWVSNAGIGRAGIYKSVDFGNTWVLLNTGIPAQGTVERIKLAIAPGDPNYIYALCCDNTEGFYGMYKSTNAGTSWTYLSPQLNILEAGQGTNSGGQGPYDMAMIVSASNKNTIFTGGINLWGSVDGGVTFNPATHWTLNYGNNTIHGDIHYMAHQPGSGNIFVCSDGGIYKTSNLQTGSWSSGWNTTWTKLNSGMQCTSFYRLSSSKNAQGRLIAGAQDNASFYYDGNSWNTIFGGDGMDNYINPSSNQEVVGSSQYGTFYYSNSHGAFGTVVGSNPLNESAEWVTPIVADYNHPGVLYAGNENVVKSTDNGQTWTALAGIYSNSVSLTNTEISALAVSNTNSNVIYAARRVRYELGMKGIVFRTTNGGTSFSNITGNLPDTLYYTGIEASPSSQDEAVVCMAGFASGCKVFRTTNGGGNWTNISYNLPNIPVNCIKYLPGSGGLIVATDLGLYILDPGSSSWYGYSSGLPNVIVSDIEFNPALNRAYVSTFGRGIWETSISQMTATPVSTTGIGNMTGKAAPDFMVYPAISKGHFNILLEDDSYPVQMEAIDVNGRIVHTQTLSKAGHTVSLQVTPGAYYIRIRQEKKFGVKKVLIE